jgi:hypothetical protein
MTFASPWQRELKQLTIIHKGSNQENISYDLGLVDFDYCAGIDKLLQF